MFRFCIKKCHICKRILYHHTPYITIPSLIHCLFCFCRANQSWTWLFPIQRHPLLIGLMESQLDWQRLAEIGSVCNLRRLWVHGSVNDNQCARDGEIGLISHVTQNYCVAKENSKQLIYNEETKIPFPMRNSTWYELLCKWNTDFKFFESQIV